MKNHPDPTKVSNPFPTLCAAFALTLLALSTVACGGGPAEESPTGEPADAAETASEVEYEPAYPEEVSDEELSEEDAQQQATHAHGEGEEHAHGDDEGHMHGDDEGHMHDGDDDHMHDGDDSHMNDDEGHMHDEHGDDGHQN